MVRSADVEAERKRPKLLSIKRLVKGGNKTRPKDRSRGSIGDLNSKYSLVADSEVTPGSLEVWSDLPEEIRNDPSLAPFRDRYERQFGAPPHSEHISIPDELHSDCERQSTKEGLANGHTNHLSIDHGSTGKLSGVGSASGATLFESTPFIPALAKSDPNQHKVSFLSNNMVVEGQAGLMPNNHKTPSKLPHDALGHDDTDTETGHKTKPWVKTTKIGILLICWVVFTTILMLKNEKVEIVRQLSVPINKTKSFLFLEPPTQQQIKVALSGPFLPEQYGNMSKKWLRAWVELVSVQVPVTVDNISALNQGDVIFRTTLSDTWYIPLVSGDMVDFVPELRREHSFYLENITLGSTTTSTALNTTQPDLLRLTISSDLGVITPVAMTYDLKPIDIKQGVLMAACVLAGLYVLIVFEIVHRTFAAMLASTMSVAILAALDERPSTSEVISWIDVETLLLLFSMMVLVAILSETGIFDYLAVYAYKVTGGKVWPLINYLCFFTAIMSSFLDNVTTVLLMTPVTIRLCEVMELNPVPILMTMIIYSNVGGTLTPVGDPPNVIIASNSEIVKAGIDFTTFTFHMSFGIVLVAIQTYIHLRYYFRDMNSLRHSEPKHVQELRREISIWQRAAASLSSYSKDEDIVRETLLKKVNKLLAQLKKKLKHGGDGGENYRANLQELTAKYPIRNRVLLVKSAVAVLFVIIVFFLHSIPELQRLSLGWTALLGALLLLILADREDMEAVLARVEWSTLLFFAALFILMEALSKLGLIDWIGKQTENVILSVSEESRLAVAILLILWVSAIASAFVDNIPLTTMMIRIATSLGNNPELNLPLQPLVWALAFGACLGGNGTLIGASANVVCAGVAEQHGYRFTFMEYFKVGFPVMLGSIVVATGYLLVCHCVIHWH